MNDYEPFLPDGRPAGPAHGGEQAQRSIRVVSASEFAGRPVPDREWLVPDLVPSNTVTILNGDGGTGKSLLAAQLAVATVARTDWIGLRVTSGPCLYLSAEDDIDELHRRLAKIAERAGIDLTELAALQIVPLAGEDALLAVPDVRGNVLKPTSLFAAVEAQIAEAGPGLVVLDTLADLYGGEENQRAQARQFVGLLRGWAIKYRMAVLLLAHPSLAGMASGSGSSGSTAWNNSVRSRLYLERISEAEGGKVFEPDPDARVLRTVKANYGRTGSEIPLRWQDGMLVAKEQRATAGLAKMSAEHRADDVFLSLLAKLAGEGRNVSPTPNSPTYAPAYFSKHGDANGITKRGLEAAMNRLFTAGKIIVAKSDGPPSKQKDVIVAAGAKAE